MARSSFRFGIGEWYGEPLASMTVEARQKYVAMQFQSGLVAPKCPFRAEVDKTCWKKGGVCSLRLYEKTTDGEVRASVHGGALRATCPSRFEQAGTIYAWVGEVLLKSNNVVPVGQVSFLERMPLMGDGSGAGTRVAATEEVGRIDNVLIVPGSYPLAWCPIEIQAVYFSGDKMDFEFRSIQAHVAEGIPFPSGRRRPDYRSSGPKRLLPQLLVKVPTLRRWGKKMAVVVDEAFFAELGRMEPVTHVSNCDVAWFIVQFREGADGFVLERKSVFLTTLESSENGLVAARPVVQEEFERRIKAKLSDR